MKTIRHKWDKLPGLKHAECPKCKCVKKFDTILGRVVFTDRFGKIYFVIPDCVMANTLI